MLTSSVAFILFATVASTSALAVERKGATKPAFTSASFDRLHKVAQEFHSERNRPMFNLQELRLQDEILAAELESVKDFNSVPSTWKDTIAVFFQQASMQFTISALVSTILFRLSQAPIAAADVGVFFIMAIFWYVQEWLVHHSIFHGNEGGTSVPPFEYHDWHHDIPYFHVATDSFKVCAAWFAGVSALTGMAVHAGLPSTLALDALATYTFFGLTYEASHYLAHTKAPLTGWLQEMRSNHVGHHLTPTEYLSMNPAVDEIMESGTEISDALSRLEAKILVSVLSMLAAI